MRFLLTLSVQLTNTGARSKYASVMGHDVPTLGSTAHRRCMRKRTAKGIPAAQSGWVHRPKSVLSQPIRWPRRTSVEYGFSRGQRARVGDPVGPCRRGDWKQILRNDQQGERIHENRLRLTLLAQAIHIERVGKITVRLTITEYLDVVRRGVI